MTPIYSFLLLCTYVVTSVSGLVLMKLENDFLSLRFAFGGFLYGLGFLLWFAILKLLPLSLAFPLAAGCLIIGTQLAGKFVLKESIGPVHLAGLLFIFIGIVILLTRYRPEA